jgi:hypothetical protein
MSQFYARLCFTMIHWPQQSLCLSSFEAKKDTVLINPNKTSVIRISRNFCGNWTAHFSSVIGHLAHCTHKSSRDETLQTLYSFEQGKHCINYHITYSSHLNNRLDVLFSKFLSKLVGLFLFFFIRDLSLISSHNPNPS